MTDGQQREASRQFFYKWNSKGKEDGDARSYWIDILQTILGVENVTHRAVMTKYGMPIKETDEASCVALLMRLYQEKVGEQK